jgi:hypothetical protein
VGIAYTVSVDEEVANPGGFASFVKTFGASGPASLENGSQNHACNAFAIRVKKEVRGW